MAKVVKVDNFNRDIFDDVLIAANVTEKHGKLIVDALNDVNQVEEWYYVLWEDDAELAKREW